MLLSYRYDDCRRSGDGERPALPAFPSPQFPGHSIQGDQAGPNRHEHSFHPAQCRHQDQGNLSARRALRHLVAVNCKLFPVFTFFFTISLPLTREQKRLILTQMEC